MQSRFLKVSECAKIVGVSTRTIRRLGERGYLDLVILDPDAKRPTYLVRRASFDGLLATLGEVVKKCAL